MGALVHNQNLYRFRPWELSKSIAFDIFSIETPLLKIDIMQNIDIMRVSPLMLDGFRYLLSDTSRYSYFYYNYRSDNQNYIQTQKILIKNISWIRIINYVQYICNLNILTSFLFLFNIFNKKILKNDNFYFIKYSNFFYIFVIDTIDISNLKALTNFSLKNFGYIKFNFINKISINILNNLNKICISKKLKKNYYNLELNITKIINFKMQNSNFLLDLKTIKYSDNKQNDLNIYIYLLIDLILNIILNKNIDITYNNFNILKYFNFIYNFFNNKGIIKYKKSFYLGNLKNYTKLNLNNLMKNKQGIFFLNSNLDYNLIFLGIFNNLNFDFNYNNTLLSLNNTSIINWLNLKNSLKFNYKYININLKIDNNLNYGLNIPIKSIINSKEIYFFNIFNEFKFLTSPIIKDTLYKSIKNIINIFNKKLIIKL